MLESIDEGTIPEADEDKVSFKLNFKTSIPYKSAFEWCKRTLPDDTRWKVLGLMQGGCAGADG